MLKKTIEFSTYGTRLSVKHCQLVIERPDLPNATVPIEDIGVVIIDDVRASYTQAVFIELLNAGATVLITGKDHLPLGMMLPLDANSLQTERHRSQIIASEPLKKRVWQSLVISKISQQGKTLEHFFGENYGLIPMSKRVKSGDVGNLEAQAAQKYWPKLFGKDFRRDRSLAGINAALNYGYAIVRAAAARAIVGAGLIPTLGVFHKNRNNPFCLADDMFEPYRPYVDWRVKLMVNQMGDEAFSLDDRAVRATLLSVFNETIEVGNRRVPILIALTQTANSLCRAFTHAEKELALPCGMPLSPDLLETFEDS